MTALLAARGRLGRPGFGGRRGRRHGEAGRARARADDAGSQVYTAWSIEGDDGAGVRWATSRSESDGVAVADGPGARRGARRRDRADPGAERRATRRRPGPVVASGVTRDPRRREPALRRWVRPPLRRSTPRRRRSRARRARRLEQRRRVGAVLREPRDPGAHGDRVTLDRLEPRDPVEHAPGDGHAGRPRRHDARTRRRRCARPCRRAGPSPRARPRPGAATWSPAREPDVSLSAEKPSTSNSATETSLPWRWARATSSSRTRPSVRALDSPVSGSVCATRSNHSARSVGHRRRAERRDRRRREVRDRDQQRLLGRVDLVVALPAERQHADARLDAAAGDDQRQVGERHRAPVGRRPRAPQRARSDRAPPGGSGAPRPRRPSTRSPTPARRLIPSVSSSSRRDAVGIGGEQRGHRRARRGRAGLDDHRQGGVEVVRARERRGAGREDGERPGAVPAGSVT